MCKGEIMSRVPSVKILVSYHKPAISFPESNIFVPIHAGRACNKDPMKDGSFNSDDTSWLHEHMIGDDTGDNISHMNRRFCETTAIYWAWKNYQQLGSPDYIGFMHYQRYLIFNDSIQPDDRGTTKVYPMLTPSLAIELGLTDESILSLLATDKPDLVSRKEQALSTFCSAKNNMEQYATSKFHHREIMCTAIDIAKELYPEMKPHIDEHVAADHAWFCNVFVLKKELFFEYCEWLFSVLFELDKRIDYSKYSVHEARAIGFTSERLTDIFFRYLSSKNIVFRKLPMARFERTPHTSPIIPAFPQQNAICIACDKNYALYAGVLLHSIAQNSNPDIKYDIVVLERELPDLHKNKILSAIAAFPNIKLRFYNVAQFIDSLKFHSTRYITEATYYRFFIQKIFSQYKKAVYLDIDTVVLTDISAIFDVDLTNNYIGAVIDYGLGAKVGAGIGENISYFTDEVGITDPIFSYFNAGVLLLNIPEFIRNDLLTSLLTVHDKHKKPFIYVDQDILNKVCYGKVVFLDSAWNTYNNSGMRKNLMHCMPLKNYKKYLQDRNNPKIIHYASSQKPWNYPDEDLAHFWWAYAKKTPFYEEILVSCFRHLLSKIPSHLPKPVSQPKPTQIPTLRKRFESKALDLMPEWMAKFIVPSYRYIFQKIKYKRLSSK